MVASLTLAEGGPTVGIFAELVMNKGMEPIQTRTIRAPLALKMAVIVEGRSWFSITTYERSHLRLGR